MEKTREAVSILSEPSDCLWLVLDTKREVLTFTTQLLREIDWKTRGFLTKVVAGSPSFSETVFIPVAGRLASKLCAVDTVKTFDPEKFARNIEGLGANKAVVIFENEKVRTQVDGEMGKSKFGKLFKKFQCIEDHP